MVLTFNINQEFAVCLTVLTQYNFSNQPMLLYIGNEQNLNYWLSHIQVSECILILRRRLHSIFINMT